MSRIVTIVGPNADQVEEQASAIGGERLFDNRAEDVELDEYKHIAFPEMVGARSKELVVNHYEKGKMLYVIILKK
ncbi:hypothetical protein C7451_11718 [Blastomonas natatoria]|uniref:Uncharacterized protein n=1 Tax=Blastomonas natatoria TaxID=34015 RepID=A0A2V3UPK7_9SPHN|nr:hypothetical protein [Blastomonas natatoria]PXW68428.1 hypothetical protein C7451_11718 [Blastomonas natatoria]